MNKAPQPTFEAAAVIFASAFVSLVAVGMVKSYSPVPFWDMWDSYLGFYLRVEEGD